MARKYLFPIFLIIFLLNLNSLYAQFVPDHVEIWDTVFKGNEWNYDLYYNETTYVDSGQSFQIKIHRSEGSGSSHYELRMPDGTWVDAGYHTGSYWNMGTFDQLGTYWASVDGTVMLFTVSQSVIGQLDYGRVIYTYQGVEYDEQVYSGSTFYFDSSTEYRIYIWLKDGIGTPTFFYRFFKQDGTGSDEERESSAFNRYMGSFNDEGALVIGVDMDHPTGGQSFGFNAITPCPDQVVPTGVSASDGEYADNIRISWDSTAGAYQYQIYRNTINDPNTAIILWPWFTSATFYYDDTSASPDQTYYYWVRARNDCGNVSDYSAPDTGYAGCPAQAEPTGVVASDGTYTDRIRISWNNTTGAYQYQIYRNTINDPNTAIILWPWFTSATFYYDDTSASPGQTFYYWVRARNDCGSESVFSSGDSGSVGIAYYNLSIDVDNIPGGFPDVPGTYGHVYLYDVAWNELDHEQTDSDGVVFFGSLQIGEYNYRVYVDSPSGLGTEFWGEGSVILDSDRNIQHVRNWPYIENIQLIDTSNDQPISWGDTVLADTELRIEITIRNPNTSSINSFANVLLDEDKASPYIFDVDASEQLIPENNGESISTAIITLDSVGDFYFAARTLSNYGGNFIITDTSAFDDDQVIHVSGRGLDIFGQIHLQWDFEVFGETYSVIRFRKDGVAEYTLPFDVPHEQASVDNLITDESTAKFVFHEWIVQRRLYLTNQKLIERNNQELERLRDYSNLDGNYWLETSLNLLGPAGGLFTQTLFNKRISERASLGATAWFLFDTVAKAKLSGGASLSTFPFELADFIIGQLTPELDPKEVQALLYYYKEMGDPEDTINQIFDGFNMNDATQKYSKAIQLGLDIFGVSQDLVDTSICIEDLYTVAKQGGDVLSKKTLLNTNLSGVYGLFSTGATYLTGSGNLEKEIQAWGYVHDEHCDVIYNLCSDLIKIAEEITSLRDQSESQYTMKKLQNLENKYVKKRFFMLPELMTELFTAQYFHIKRVRDNVWGPLAYCAGASAKDEEDALEMMNDWIEDLTGPAGWREKHLEYELESKASYAEYRAGIELLNIERNKERLLVKQNVGQQLQLKAGLNSSLDFTIENISDDSLSNFQIDFQSPFEDISFSITNIPSSLSSRDDVTLTLNADVPYDWFARFPTNNSGKDNDLVNPYVKIPVTVSYIANSLSGNEEKFINVVITPPGTITSIEPEKMNYQVGERVNFVVDFNLTFPSEVAVILQCFKPDGSSAGLGGQITSARTIPGFFDITQDYYGSYGFGITIADTGGNILIPEVSCPRTFNVIPPLNGTDTIDYAQAMLVGKQDGDEVVVVDLADTLEKPDGSIIWSDGLSVPQILAQVGANDIILVGGNLSNPLVQQLILDRKLANGLWTTAGECNVIFIQDAFSVGQDVIVIAGYRARDTEVAGISFATYYHNRITLSSIEIVGPNEVDENTNTQYNALAHYSDDSSSGITAGASWSENSTYAAISESGSLTTLDVPSDQLIQITAIYEEGGITRTDTHDVIIKNISVIPPTITIHPQSQTIDYNTSVQLFVTATGTEPLSYQWYQGIRGDISNPIAGATFDTYQTPNLIQITNYWVRVTNIVDSRDSNTAVIIVNIPVLDVSPSNWSAPAAGGTSPTINVTNSGTGGSFGYTVSESADWLSLSSTNGTTPGSFTITATVNDTMSSRTADVTVSTGGAPNSPQIVTVIQAAQNISTLERNALIALYNSTNGDNWTENSGWKEAPLHSDGFAMPGTEENWYGVTLDNLHTIQISLIDNNLSGTIPPEIGNFPYLESLSLRENHLTGNIPPQLGNLSNLQNITLAANQLTGSIPNQLGNLSNLTSLYMTSNQLTGSIPPQFGNPSNLERLSFGGNQLSGSIPPELGSLAELETLNLSYNQLTGVIPPEIGNLANLILLQLNSNNLDGSIPSTLANLINIPDNDLYIGYNALFTDDDTLRTFLNSKDPDWEETQTVAPSDVSATAVSWSSVNVTWTPISFSSYTGGYRVFYSETSGGPWTEAGMTADKTASEYLVTNLAANTTYYFIVRTQTNPHGQNTNTVVSDDSDEASATTSPAPDPPTITIHPQSQTIDYNTSVILSVTATGTEPLNYQWYQGLSGDVSNPIAGATSDTYQTPPLTQTTNYWVRVTNVVDFRDSNTAVITVLIPVLDVSPSTWSATAAGGTSPTINVTNSGTGGSFSYTVSETADWLSLSSSGGTTPGSFTITASPNATGSSRFADVIVSAPGAPNSPQIVTVTQPAQSITTSERNALIALYNSTNGDNWTNNSGWKEAPLHSDGFALPGTEGDWYGIWLGSGHVTTIDLSDNNLIGTIPAEIQDLNQLRNLILSNNYLGGNIPKELANIPTLFFLFLNNNQLTGTIPAQLGSCSQLSEVYLNSNLLSGEIPGELGNLSDLYYLDLSSNLLTGSIPPELGNLSGLDYLDLAWNHLSGSIPPELGNLPSWFWHLDLSSNELEGNIPIELINITSIDFLNLAGNKLIGEIPNAMVNLVNLNTLDIGYNGLYTDDGTLRIFLDSKDPDWESTQTVAPTDVSATAVSWNSVNVTWTPIAYTSDPGGYRVSYSETSGGPWTEAGMTADKTASEYLVTSLAANTPYYFVVQTQTDPHGQNPNTVVSEDSEEASDTTHGTCVAPSITQHPQNQTINYNTSAILEVAATGTGPFEYQWYRGTSGDTSNPVGPDSNEYITPNLVLTTQYWVRVTNDCGHADSNTATITVLPLEFNTDVNALSVPEGDTNNFQVRLSSQPASNVSVSISRVSGDSDITVQSGSSLTFTTSSWSQYQMVILAAADDSDDINGQATIRISASGIPNKDIIATEQDDDIVAPEISVKQGTTDIPDGGSFNYGSQFVGTNTDITFTIENSGATDLILSGSPIITITGTNADQFSVEQQPTSPVGAGNTTTFIIRFSPTSKGTKTASISITNNDSDENPYDITLNGAGIPSSGVLFEEDWNSGVIDSNDWNFVDNIISWHGGHKASVVDGELFINAWDDWTCSCGIISKEGFPYNTRLTLKFRIHRVRVDNQFQTIIHFIDSADIDTNGYPTGNELFSIGGGNDDIRDLFVWDKDSNKHSLGFYEPDQDYILEIIFTSTETRISANGYTVTLPEAYPIYHIHFGGHVEDSYFDDLFISSLSPIYVFDGHDFDGNLISDVSVFRPSNGKWYIRGIATHSWGTSGDFPVNGDYNGDGTTDIAVWRPSNGRWYIRSIGVYSWGTGGDVPVPGDYDGDGRTDIAVWRPSNGRWYIRGIGAYSWGTGGDVPVPGDYDGDGRTDIAVWRPSNGRWYIRGIGAYSWGIEGDVPVPGDYDGDGRTDIAVWRQSNGKWYIRSQGVYSWGTSGDMPVPGDYNGDGTTDIGVWRPSDGKWYIRDTGVYSWGTSGDIPLVR